MLNGSLGTWQTCLVDLATFRDHTSPKSLKKLSAEQSWSRLWMCGHDKVEICLSVCFFGCWLRTKHSCPSVWEQRKESRCPEKESWRSVYSSWQALFYHEKTTWLHVLFSSTRSSLSSLVNATTASRCHAAVRTLICRVLSSALSASAGGADGPVHHGSYSMSTSVQVFIAKTQ